MKTLVLLTILFLVAPLARAFEPEKIVIVSGGDFSHLESLLKSGWTVKAQSSTPTTNGSKYGGPANEIHLFTLTPPTAEARASIEADLAAERARKAAEFQKRREEYLRAKAAATVELPAH